MDIDNLEYDEFDWMKGEDVCQNIDPFNVKKNMTMINVHRIYLDSDSNILHVRTISLSLEERDQPYINILAELESYRDTRYTISDIVLFNITAEINENKDENIVKMAHSFICNDFKDIVVIEPSMPAFHDINCIYVIYNENIPEIPSPILKSGIKVTTKKTKRVSFIDKHKYTRKRN